MSPAGVYLLKVDNRNARTWCEICSKLSIKTPEQRYLQNIFLTCSCRMGNEFVSHYTFMRALTLIDFYNVQCFSQHGHHFISIRTRNFHCFFLELLHHQWHFELLWCFALRGSCRSVSLIWIFPAIPTSMETYM